MIYNKGDYKISGRSGTFYYIHRNKEHFIGQSETAKLYNSIRQRGYDAAKKRFQMNYLESMSPISQNAYNALDASLSEEETFTVIDSEIVNSLNATLNQAELEANNIGVISESTLNTYNEMERYFKSKYSDMKAFNNILKIIGEATKIFETDDLAGGTTLSAILLQDRRLSSISNYGFGKLKRALERKKRYFESQDVISFNNQVLLQLIQSIQNLIQIEQSNLSGLIKREQIKQCLNNIFSGTLGKNIVGHILKNSDTILLNMEEKNMKQLNNVISNVQIAGEEDSLKYNLETGKNFKTDSIFRNATISIDIPGTNQLSGEFNINLGINTRWYNNSLTGSSFTNTASTEFNERLVPLINKLGLNDRQLYLTYNALSAYENQELINYIKSALLNKNIDLIFSGLNKTGDFSQFVFINDQFYSIWQIILNNKDILDTNLINLETMQDENIDRLFDGYRPNYLSAYVNIRNMQPSINNIRFSASLHLSKLKRASFF